MYKDDQNKEQVSEKFPVRCLRERDLNEIFNCSNTLRKELVKSPDFPKPFRLNKTFKVWSSVDIYDWLEHRRKEYSVE
jgi:predicted DNA-binding transcriptional regulator AlpA